MANQISIEFDDAEAQRAIATWREVVGDGAEDAVRQLAMLAERFMKEEAPEGVGIPNVNLTTTIASEQVSSDPFGMVIKPRKLTQDGWPLHHAIVGNPSTPTYDDVRPPIDPLMAWASAKLGDPQAAWPIRESIYQDGQDSFPNPFIDDSVERWQNRVQQISDDAVSSAFGGGL